jgi:hypothetical protein
MIAAYSCSDNQNSTANSAADCHLASFLENFSDNFNKEDVYFIKGVASKLKHYGGLNIKLVEDLKGNFPKEVATFTAWGGYNPSPGNTTLERLDNFSIYKNQDTLLMLLTPSTIWKYSSEPEKKGDYTSIQCAYSVLKLSGGYVIGFIIPELERERWWEGMSQEERTLFVESLSPEEYLALYMDTMPWEELHKKLQKLLESNKT